MRKLDATDERSIQVQQAGWQVSDLLSDKDFLGVKDSRFLKRIQASSLTFEYFIAGWEKAEGLN